jgi:TonB family protein
MLLIASLTRSLALSADFCAPVQIVGAKYPENARSARIEGLVRVSLSIAADGTVASMRVESGHAVLVRFVESEVREWKFPRQDAGIGNCRAIKMNWVFNLGGYCDYRPHCKEKFVFKYPNTVVLTSEIPSLQP